MMQRRKAPSLSYREIMKQSGMDAAGGVAGRVALVTGAGAGDGIGFAAAKLLAAAGAKVAITSTTKRIFERLKELPAEDEPEIFAHYELDYNSGAGGERRLARR